MMNDEERTPAFDQEIPQSPGSASINQDLSPKFTAFSRLLHINKSNRHEQEFESNSYFNECKTSTTKDEKTV